MIRRHKIRRNFSHHLAEGGGLTPCIHKLLAIVLSQTVFRRHIKPKIHVIFRQNSASI